MQEKTVGYARTASSQQSVEGQIDALKQAGCSEIFSDVGASGNTLDHPGLRKAKAALRRGDTLMVCRTDRLSRHAPSYYRFLRDLLRDGIEFKSIENNEEAQDGMVRVNHGPALPPDAPLHQIAFYRLGRFFLRQSGHESNR